MTTPAEPDASEPGRDLSADELQAEIERTREQLGDTVDALSQKLDVKAQSRHKLESLRQGGAAKVDTARVRAGETATKAKDAATDARGKPRTGLLAGTGLVVVSLAAGAAVVWRRRR